ncbi:MAG TPA: hypothetical protein VFX76_01375, partial [Roseiflexaceae bacterium]|nr:hypothetical protein [Roseiflexaceae bacterium]
VELGDLPWTHEIYQLTDSELADVAGSSVVFAIYVKTDQSYPSSAWIDNAAVYLTTSGTGSTPTPTATATATGTATPPPSGGGGSPLRVTLSWTDFPGEPAAAKALVNDLDLEIVAPNGTRYSGNQGIYTSGQCLRGGKWDACNTTEGVIIPQAGAGTYTIIVRGVQVPQGGRQPFALTASGNGLQSGNSSAKPAIWLPLIQRGGSASANVVQATPTPPVVPTPAAVKREAQLPSAPQP